MICDNELAVYRETTVFIIRSDDLFCDPLCNDDVTFIQTLVMGGCMLKAALSFPDIR